MPADIGNDIVRHLPYLLMLARTLARDRSLADDLVQETAVRALGHADQFRPGTNLRAWLTTILCNSYYSEKRRSRRQAPLDWDSLAESLATNGGQEGSVRLNEFRRLLGTLPRSQRSALVLVGAGGYSYDQAARKAGCAVGTMKSRVCRARSQLLRRLEGRERTTRSAPGWQQAGAAAITEH